MKLKTFISKINVFRLKNFGNTQKAVYIVAMLITAAVGGFSYIDSGLNQILSFVIAAILSILAANIALGAAMLIYKFLIRNGIVYFICLAALTAVLAGLINVSCGGNVSIVVSIVTALLMVWALLTFARNLWAMTVNRVRSAAVITSAAVSGILTAAGLLFSFSGILGSFHISYVEQIIPPIPGNNAPSGFSEEFESGGYTVETLYYGDVRGTEGKTVLESGEVNLGPYVGGYDGIQKIYRKLYQGYDIYNVPLTGKVWYPKEAEKCPVVFIIHGNHNLTADSYEGYDYLGGYLASHGYVAVSVDSNSCNGCIFGGLSGDNDGRAVLLLKNITQVLRYNKDAGSPLFNKIDEENIAVAGHSRGGEAAALAVLFNQLERYPSNGTIRFYWNGIKIKSVIAIAPSVNQYMPADHEVELEDVNYLLIQGINDQDVTSFMGATQYENLSFSGHGQFLKTSLYIAGANHGQFNTRWGRYDMSAPLSAFLNTEDLLPEAEQQEILKIFVKAFLDSTLKGSIEYSGLLRDCEDYREYLPNTVYTQVYEESGFISLCDFEKDADLTSESGGEVSLEIKGAEKWTEEMSEYSNSSEGGGEKGGYVLCMNWDTGQKAEVALKFEPMNCEDKTLRFDIADTDTEAIENGEYEALEVEITLIDADGNEAAVPLKEYTAIYPPVPVYQGRLQYILGKPEYKVLYRTVAIPVSDLSEAAENIDTGEIVGIKISFDGKDDGAVNLDNIGFG